MEKRKSRLFFKTAIEYARNNYRNELEWAREIKPFKNMKSKEFLSQYCWVIYAYYFKESVLEQKFDMIEKGFKYFDIQRISKITSIKPVLRAFNNESKARIFLKGAKMIYEQGFSQFKKRVLKEGMRTLQELPGIGEITQKHLARNIGLADVAKNDVHIQKLVKYFNAKDERELVEYLSKISGGKKGVVDVILWRFCAKMGWKQLGYDSLGSYIKSL
jgi:thermostable 8-oxoguanine DNA glycosylase